MKCKWNLPARFTNPWFWVGLAGVVLTATGVQADSLNSWPALAAALKQVAANPYLLASALLAALGVFTDPTTDGLSDPLPPETVVMDAETPLR